MDGVAEGMFRSLGGRRHTGRTITRYLIVPASRNRTPRGFAAFSVRGCNRDSGLSVLSRERSRKKKPFQENRGASGYVSVGSSSFVPGCLLSIQDRKGVARRKHEQSSIAQLIFSALPDWVEGLHWCSTALTPPPTRFPIFWTLPMFR